MNWYLSKIIFQIIRGSGNHQPQFDEQLRLIAASDELEAFEKAHSIGNREQDAFYNEKDQLVQWKFIGIGDLYQLRELLDGAEMYSRIQEPEDATAYTLMIHRKNAQLQSGNSRKLLQLL